MVVLTYTEQDEDLKFILYCLEPTATFLVGQHLSLYTDQLFEDIDGIIQKLFELALEDCNTKKINEFKRFRNMQMHPKMEFSVTNLLCYINTVKSMLLTGSLKNKEIIDQFTGILVKKEIKFDPEFYMLEMRAGRIITIQEAEGLDNLYCESVRAGRDYFICSGLRGIYKKEELIDKTYLFILNIKKAKFKALESEGMICCTEGDRIEALEVVATEGTRVELEGHLKMFEGLVYGKVDLNKQAYRSALSKFRIVDHVLHFKDSQVMIEGTCIRTETKNGPVR